MNLEIKKFWTDSNYIVVADWLHGCGVGGMESRCIWALIKDGYEIFSFRGESELQPLKFDVSGKIIEAKELPPCTTYRFVGNEYTEEEMLRIIKLKAFL